MKLISKILCLLFLTKLLISCTITEEITFNQEGSLSYSYLMNARLAKLTSDSLNTDFLPKDTIFSFNSFFQEKKDSILKLPLEKRKNLYALKPFFIKGYRDKEKDEYYVRIYGDFANSDSLNSALAALHYFNNLYENILTFDILNDFISNRDIDFLTICSYNWNGKELIKKSVASDSIKHEYFDLKHFPGSKFKIKYIFPSKIKRVDNPLATISKDRKSITMEYDDIVNPEYTNLKVELENINAIN